MSKFAFFYDRWDAGQQLAIKLSPYKNALNSLILALPRGGVPVAYEVSQQLNLPLDVFLVRKLGMPFHQELAMGALASNNIMLLDNDIISQFNISEKQIEDIIKKEKAELERREIRYRKSRPMIPIAGKNIFLIDDGIATGATMKIAIIALKKMNPAKITVAVPVASSESFIEINKIVNEVICLQVPELFYSVGMFYEIFPQTSDQEVCDLLENSNY